MRTDSKLVQIQEQNEEGKVCSWLLWKRVRAWERIQTSLKSKMSTKFQHLWLKRPLENMHLKIKKVRPPHHTKSLRGGVFLAPRKFFGVICFLPEFFFASGHSLHLSYFHDFHKPPVKLLFYWTSSKFIRWSFFRCSFMSQKPIDKFKNSFPGPYSFLRWPIVREQTTLIWLIWCLLLCWTCLVTLYRFFSDRRKET